MISLALEGCSSKSGDTRNGGGNMNVQLSIASDQNQFWTNRVDAVAKLDARDQEELRRILAARLPGDWDAKTLDDIEVIGLVGNKDTVDQLKRLENQPTNIPGKINSAIDRAIASIKSREN